MSAMTYDTSIRSRRRSAPTSSAPLRLTRRGRAVVVLLAMLLLFAAFAVGRSSSADAGGHRPATRRETLVVESGDTLWTIARRIAPTADTRDTVARLIEINDIGRRPLRAGERITLP